MKKFIIFSLIAVMVAGTVFAQTANGISVNAWGRGAFTPLQYVTAPKVDGDVPDGAEGEVFAGTGVTWGGSQPRVDFRINGNSDFVGFGIHTNSESGVVGDGDNGGFIWVKPFSNDYLKLTAGKFIVDDLRGKIGNLDGGFSNFVLMDTPEEDAIFNRFGAGSTRSTNGDGDASFLLSSAPIDGLFIGLLLDGALYKNWGGAGSGSFAAHTYRYMQVGAGYNIDGIGHIRAQYIGGWFGTVDLADEDTVKYYEANKPARIEVAFALTAVDGLLVDLGAKIGLPLEIKDATKSSSGIGISLGAQYNMDAIGIGARVDVSGLNAYTRAVKDDDSADGMHMVIRLVPTYSLDIATIGLDVAFAVDGKAKDANGDAIDGTNGFQMGFGAFVQKGLGSGQVKAGLSYTLPPMNSDGAQGSGVFQIPIILEYAFF